jgi:hypothetical protein
LVSDPFFDAVLDALLLIRIALHVGLHALRGCGIRIPGLRVMLLAIDIPARVVLRAFYALLLRIGHLAILQRIRLHLVDVRFFAFKLAGFLGGELAGFQTLLDTILLVHVTLRSIGGVLCADRCCDAARG